MWAALLIFGLGVIVGASLLALFAMFSVSKRCDEKAVLDDVY